jgi:small subunit ribosomal protein YMR-31
MLTSTPSAPHAPKPHPQAPKEIAENFQSFLSKLNSSSGGASSPSSSSKSALPSSSGSSSSGKKAAPVDFEVFYEAPSRLWKTKPLEEFEIEAIMVS